MIRATLLLFTFLLCVSCRADKVVAPEKLSIVPDTAIWQGGSDGGAWYDCLVTSVQFEYTCTIYNDYTGNVEASSIFVMALLGANGVLKLSDDFLGRKLNTNDILGFDGEKIHLQGSLALVPK